MFLFNLFVQFFRCTHKHLFTGYTSARLAQYSLRDLIIAWTIDF